MILLFLNGPFQAAGHATTCPVPIGSCFPVAIEPTGEYIILSFFAGTTPFAMSAITATATIVAAASAQLDEQLYTVVPSTWYQQRGVEWPLLGLQFDGMGEHGQARRLDLAVVVEKVESFGHAAPSEPYSVTLWPCDKAGMLLSFYVT